MMEMPSSQPLSKKNQPSLLRRIFSRARSSRKPATSSTENTTASTSTTQAISEKATDAATRNWLAAVPKPRQRPFHKRRHRHDEDNDDNANGVAAVPMPPPCERTASYETAQTYDMTVASSMSEERYHKMVASAQPQRTPSPLQNEKNNQRGTTRRQTRAPPGHNALSPSLRMGSFRQLQQTPQGGNMSSSNSNSIEVTSLASGKNDSIKVTTLAMLSSATASASSRVHRSTGTESLGEFQPHQPNHPLQEESLLDLENEDNDDDDDYEQEFNYLDFALDIDLDLDQQKSKKQEGTEHDNYDDYDDHQSTGSSCSGLTTEDHSYCFDNGNLHNNNHDDSSTVVARLNTLPLQQPVGRLGEGVVVDSSRRGGGSNGGRNMASPKTASTKQPVRRALNGMLPPTYIISMDDEEDDDVDVDEDEDE